MTNTLAILKLLKHLYAVLPHAKIQWSGTWHTGMKGSFSLTILEGASSSLIICPMVVFSPVRQTITNTSSSELLGFQT